MTEYPDKIDLHMHSTVSDGTDTPRELLARVRAEGIKLFSITDHDAVKASVIISDILADGDPDFISGAEFSCKDDEGKYHILGYGCDPLSSAIRSVVETGHRHRVTKVKARLEYLKREFGMEFPAEEIDALLALDNPGKPHIGNLMVKYGYAPSKELAISQYVDRKRFKSEYVTPEEAITGILGSGGIPVLAHPSFGSGDQMIRGDMMDSRIRRLMGFGLKGVEVYYSGFDAGLRGEILSFAEKYNLYVTAGSDYHGGNKKIPLGYTGLGGPDEYPEGLRRFLDDTAERHIHGSHC